jgi:hypothetical protein
MEKIKVTKNLAIAIGELQLKHQQMSKYGMVLPEKEREAELRSLIVWNNGYDLSVPIEELICRIQNTYFISYAIAHHNGMEIEEDIYI